MIRTVMTIQDPIGLHARPAGMLAEKAQQYRCNISVRKTDDEKMIDAKSLISILIGQFVQGSEIELICEGEDEKEAMKDIVGLLTRINQGGLS